MTREILIDMLADAILDIEADNLIGAVDLIMEVQERLDDPAPIYFEDAQ